MTTVPEAWRRVLRTGLVAGHFAVWFAGLAPLGWVIVPGAWLLGGGGGRGERRRRAQRSLGLACRMFMDSMRRTGLMDFDARRVAGRLPPGACVLVANHPTLVDVLIVLAAYPEVAVMARRSIYTSSLLGLMQPCCGHIDSGDRSASAGVRAYREAAERLREGVAVLVFAEGTRSPPGALGHFSKGAFRLALEAQVPLVPLALACVPPTLTRGMPIWRYPLGHVRMDVERLATVEPSEAARHGGPRRLMREVRARIAARLAERGALAPDRSDPRARAGERIE